jgi:heme/copper-type cytochrome/quinol oxidase subunit 1
MFKLKIFTYYLILIGFLAVMWLVFTIIKLTFVFNLLDTYYVISYADFIAIVTLPTVIIAIIYKVFDYKNIDLIKSLSKVHTAITFIGLFLFVIILSLFKYISPLGTNARFPMIDDTKNVEIILFGLIAIVIFSQIIVVVNIIVSLSRYLFFNKK